MQFRDRVFGQNLRTVIDLQQTEEGLELVADDGDDWQSVIVLDDDGVRNLRLALQRYERKRIRVRQTEEYLNLRR